MSHLLTLMSQRAVQYLLLDRFTTDAAAPLTSPRTCEPGPGQMVKAVDSGNVGSIVGGKFRVAGSTAYANTRYYWTDRSGSGFARVTGRAFRFKATIVSFGTLIGGVWNSTTINTAPSYPAPFLSSNSVLATTTGASNLSTLSTGVEYTFWLVLRSTGALLIAQGGVFTTPTLVWVFADGTDATLWPGLTSSGGTHDTEDVTVTDFSGAYLSDYGLATQRLVSPAAGATFQHTADCLIDFTVTTLPNPGIPMVLFRQQDASNYWNIFINSVGDLLLREVVSGSTTTRGTASGVITAGHRVVVVAEGAVIKVYSNNVLRMTYSSATNFQTLASGMVGASLNGAVISECVAWPRVLSGAALSTLAGV